MSAGWLQALRAYVSRTGTPSTLASRHRLYDHVAQTHLTVHRGAHLRPGGLAVLREARWALLRDGTPREKADLLEHILKSLAQASEVVTYDGSTTAPGRQRRRDATRRRDDRSRAGTRGDVQQEQQDASQQQVASDDVPARFSAAAQNLSARHQLLLEQVQCLVEAKVSEIPLTARHYRYPLRSPLLAEVSPELPLLLLDELGQHHHPSRGNTHDATDRRGSASVAAAEWEARVDCSASLAGAGHTREALTLCGDDGRMFRAVVQRVARQRRDGWRQAWALATVVPMARVVGIAQPSAVTSLEYSEDWLRGVLEAVQLRARATPPRRLPFRGGGEADAAAAKDDSGGTAAAAPGGENTRTSDDDDEEEREQLFAWVDQLRQLMMVPSNTPAESRQALALRKAQRLVMNAYLSVCPPRRWREAVAVVLAVKKAAQRPPRAAPAAASPTSSRATESKWPTGQAAAVADTTVEKAGVEEAVEANLATPHTGDSVAAVVSVGRVMSLLQFARQPLMTLLFFYGDPLELLSTVTAPVPQKLPNQTAAGNGTPQAWSVSSEHLQEAVAQLLRAALESNRLSVASGALLTERDVHHAAVYNHAMAALAATGHRTEAMLFYQTIPVTCVNAYTHWGVLQIFLQPNAPHTAASALASATSYEHCQRALKRLVHTLPETTTSKSAPAAARAAHVSNDDDDEKSFTRDQANVMESMALWAALRHDVDTALLCATHAPPSCRYVHLIAMIAAANSGDFSAAARVLRQLSSSPRSSQKELCLAAAVIAVYYPLLPRGSGDARQTPERMETYDGLTRALSQSVGHQQTQFDDMVQLLVDYVSSLQRRRSQPRTPDDAQAALQNVLTKAKILDSTMDLVRLGRQDNDAPPEQQQQQQRSSGKDVADTTAVWRTVARLIQSIGGEHGLSVARAAPALVSAGAPAEVAMDLLPM